PQTVVPGVRHSTFESPSLCHCVIHGFISAGLANHYMSSLKVGSIVKVDHFEVSRCSNMYKITDHLFLICFIPPTIIDEVITDAPKSISSHDYTIRQSPSDCEHKPRTQVYINILHLCLYYVLIS
ncbi:hypothetical protein IGI04_030261, partial [Brassica rapa subsp. trilocularis]